MNKLKACCFVTIRIFARTEQLGDTTNLVGGFVTIRIFARTEPNGKCTYVGTGFVTI